MNKKILTMLLIAAIAISNLFAYTSPSVVLLAGKPEVDYNFKVQKLNAALNDYEDFEIGQVESIVIESTVGTTNAFAISTIADGNMHDEINFSALVTTGEFIGQSTAAIQSGWFPVIEDMSASATTENLIRGNEIVNFTEVNNGDFIAASTGIYATTFTGGRHQIGTEIARFKLQYKADDDLVAGTYKSTTTITISVN
jgi:hypothetical protein